MDQQSVVIQFIGGLNCLAMHCFLLSVQLDIHIYLRHGMGAFVNFWRLLGKAGMRSGRCCLSVFIFRGNWGGNVERTSHSNIVSHQTKLFYSSRTLLLKKCLHLVCE